jgi:NAD(P)-dependent dehydrogenase (short-subunit alcohol dehydrogenase family)
MEINLFGAWRTTLAFLPLLRASPHARIVNVSSEGGSLAAELRRDGILVNAQCPGWTANDTGRGGRPVSAGAASVLRAVQLPDDGPTGGFFRDGQPLPW